MINDIRSGNFPKPSALEPDIDPKLETIILKAMNISKKMRYQTISAFKTDLVSFLYSTTRSDLKTQTSQKQHKSKEDGSKTTSVSIEETSTLRRDTIFNKKIIRQLKKEMKNEQNKVQTSSDAD